MVDLKLRLTIHIKLGENSFLKLFDPHGSLDFNFLFNVLAPNAIGEELFHNFFGLPVSGDEGCSFVKDFKGDNAVFSDVIVIKAGCIFR